MKRLLPSLQCVVAALALSLAACAHATLDEAREAYAAGDLRTSQVMLADIEPASDADKRAVSELFKSVKADKDRVVASLMADAGRARGRADEGAQGYSEAISYYQAAVAVLVGNDPQLKNIKGLLDHAEDAQAAREHSFLSARHLFDTASKCSGAPQRDRLAELWALRRACDNSESLVPYAMRAADRCAKAERYDDALQLRSVLDNATRNDAGRVGVGLDEWPAEAQGWFALVEIRAQERALRTATTTTSSTATFGPVAATTNREERRKPSPRVSPSHASAIAVTAPVAAAAGPTPGRADAILARAKKLYDDGSVFDAILAVDAGLAEELVEADRAKLEQQEATWSPDRHRLIDEYLRRGESALREEQIESAYAWYQRILTLDPSHEVAQDRIRRLDRLKTIKGTSN